MALYLQSLLFVVVVVTIGYLARRKERFLSRSWKTRLEVPVSLQQHRPLWWKCFLFLVELYLKSC